MFIFKIIKWVFKLFTKRGGLSLAGLSGGALASLVTGLLGSGGQLLPALLSKLNGAGLSNLVQSWVGKGPNQPVTEEQLLAALGPETIAGVAEQTGLSNEETTAKLAEALPQLVDKLTPTGEVPDEKVLAKRLARLLK
jgi:uncharacterized protein YidB (DUF937 family)